MKIKEYQAIGETFERLLRLRTMPIALKMLHSEAQIPEGALRPKQDRGYHLAQCQAFALARRQGETVAMLKEDHWCFAPLIAYGLVDMPDHEFVRETTVCPCFPRNRYVGLVSGPLTTTTFEPDMVMIYADPGQVRRLLMAVKFGDKSLVSSVFDPIDSCAYAVVPVIEKGEYRITIPDPGEVARAAAREDKLIFSIPAAKLETVVTQLRFFAESAQAKAFEHIDLRPDFSRPSFYEEVFAQWGLDVSASR
jgi:uncharacterized protein (DUF169 family)